MAKARGFGGRAYTSASASGTPSGWPGGGATRTILNPWGNNMPASQGRRANSVGATPFKTKMRSRGGVSQPTPSSQLWSMSYKANDPQAWPIEGGKNFSAMTQAKADWNNAVVNHAFQRGGYA